MRGIRINHLIFVSHKIMGKVKPRILGLEDVEKKQKQEQKQKASEKKLNKQKKSPVGVGLDRPVSVGRDQSVSIEHAQPMFETAPKKEKKQPTKKKTVRRRGEKYQKVKQMVDKNKRYSLKEASALIKKLKTAKFDEAVELHLNVEKVGLKGEIDLPYSTGKIIKVAVVDDALLAKIEAGKLDFDILVSHPSFMPKLARFAKILGPKGLMPNPKNGTISTTPEEVVKKFAKGVLRWKTEPKFPLIHQMIGRVSLSEKQIEENAAAFLSAVGKQKIQKVVIKLTMSPGIKIDLEKLG